MSLPRKLCIILLFWVASTTLASAHVIDQIYGRFSADAQEWNYQIDYDIGLIEEELDDDEPQKPRGYLLELSKDETAELRDEIERKVRALFSFDPADYQISFPDFATSPPSYPRLLNGGAYVTVVISGQTPETGGLTMHLSEGDWPSVVIGQGPEGRPATDLRTFWAGQSEMLLSPEQIQRAGEDGSTAQIDPITRPGGRFWRNLQVGFRHVLPDGVDHILFILAICLTSRSLRELIEGSLCFTLAHSITLGIVALGKVSPGAWIEVGIAASIVLLAAAGGGVEKRLGKGLRYGLIFGLGLLHGLGFGAVMQGYFAETSAFLPLLLTLNLGVEVAQLLIVALFMLAMKLAAAVHLETAARQILRVVVILWGLYLVSGFLPAL